MPQNQNYFEITARNCIVDCEAVDKGWEAKFSEDAGLWLETTRIEMQLNPLITRIKKMLKTNTENGLICQYPTASLLYCSHPQFAINIVLSQLIKHGLQVQTILTCVLPIVEQYLIAHYSNPLHMATGNTVLEKLRKEILKHIQACDSKRTPIVCRMRSNGQQHFKLVQMIVDRVSQGEGMTIAQAIRSLENE